MQASLAVPLLAAAVALSAGAASAANLTDVRVGVHGDHTRIVLETDGKAPYIVDAGEKEIIVHVDAAATAEAVTAKSPHLIWVKVEPTPIGADVRLQLKQAADVKAMVLTGPDRIVLDLYPRKGAPPAPLPAPELLTEEAPPVTAEAPAEPPPLDEPGLPEETEPTPEELATASETPEEAAAPDAEPAEPMGASDEEELAPETPEGEEPATPPAPEAEEVAEAPPAMVAPVAEAPVRPTMMPAAPAPSGNLFGSPYLLAAVAVVLFVVFVFLRRRLRGDDRPALPGPLDEAGPFEPPQRAVPVDAPSASGESLFDVEADALGPVPKDDDALPRLRGASADSGDETERRIAHLERRIEELVDARERLERQVAAQTEELRVQRAAIARTQRVLRTVAPRGDEEPSSDPVKG
jgi:hypothetical protein